MTLFTRTGSAAIGALALATACFAACPAIAQDAKLAVELNKIETQGNGCRAYLVVKNEGASDYQSFKLDLVLFQKDGVIGRRFAMDLGPIKPEKRTVKLFDLDNISCDDIGSFLINDVMECKAANGPIEDCLARLSVKSLTNVELTK